MLAAQFVQFGQHLSRRQLATVQRHDVAVGEFEIQVFCLVRCIFRRNGPAPHAFFCLGRRVFQMTAFKADVQQIGIHGVGRAAVLVLHVDGDAVLFGVGQQLLATQQVPFTPRCDDLDAGLQRIGTQLETHLVVTLAGGAVRNSICTGLVDDVDQALGDQRARDGSAEQVFAFVHGVGAEHWKHEIAHEFFAQVVDEDVFRLDTELQCLLACGLQFFTLAEIGGESDNFAFISILQPLQDDRGIESAGVGQDRFFDVRHVYQPS